MVWRFVRIFTRVILTRQLHPGRNFKNEWSKAKVMSGTVTAFAGEELFARGERMEVGVLLWRAARRGDEQTYLVFDDQTGRPADFDLTGTEEDVRARYQQPHQDATSGAKGPGRPKLGVVGREVTLLPRHWEWLQNQRGTASSAIRRLVEEARRSGQTEHLAAQARQAADRFMAVMAGNRPGYEEASRALYSNDRARLHELTEDWPTDIRDHARHLAEPSFVEASQEDRSSLKALLLGQFETAWALTDHHLQGLTTSECMWRPANKCLHISKDPEGGWRADWPETEDYTIGPPSIAWTTWHILFWWETVLCHLEDRPPPQRESILWPGAAETACQAIGDLCAQWLRLLNGASEQDLKLPLGESWPIKDASTAQIAAWLNVELTKNAAEIGMVRFLYAVGHKHQEPEP